MGSIKTDRKGRQRHWADPERARIKRLRKPEKQPKSFVGQLPLFGDVPIKHLEATEHGKIQPKDS